MLDKPIKNKDFIKIYTDGGCLVNPNGPGGYGVVIIDNLKETEYSQGFKSTTNNRMELRAFIRALEELKEPSNIELFTDSKYLCQPFELNWIDNWLKTDWKNGKVKNIDLWKTILKLTETHFVKFTWVKGHSNNKYNNRCDELATKAYNNKNLIEDIGYNEIIKDISSINEDKLKGGKKHMNEIPYAMKIAQLEKAKGELRALVMLHYDASTGGGEVYKNIKPMVENFIKELEDNCG